MCIRDRYVTISFTDSGEGISADNMSSVFEPYFSTKKSGTGLGLLIIRRIIREHGGEMEIASEEGKGTTVTLFLPRFSKSARLLPDSGESEPD